MHLRVKRAAPCLVIVGFTMLCFVLIQRPGWRARGQSNGLAINPSTTPTYLLPDVLGSASTSGVTIHVCATCQYQPARAAVDAFSSTPDVDLTVIDEVRGDNITQGKDIFQESAIFT